MCWSRRFRNWVQSAATTPICAASVPIAVSIVPSAFAEARRDQSARRQPFFHQWARRHSDPRPGAPVDAERRPPQPAPFMGYDIENCIRGGIIRLPRRAQEGRSRREHDEPGREILPGQPVEILRPADLRSQNPFEAGPILRGERGIVDDARRVDHAAQRRPGHASFGQERAERLSIADIDRRHADLRPRGGEPPRYGRGIRTIGPAASDERNMFRAALNQPCRRL